MRNGPSMADFSTNDVDHDHLSPMTSSHWIKQFLNLKVDHTSRSPQKTIPILPRFSMLSAGLVFNLQSYTASKGIPTPVFKQPSSRVVSRS